MQSVTNKNVILLISGQIVCNICSAKRLNKLRICDECYDKYMSLLYTKEIGLDIIPIELWINDPFIRNCNICHQIIKSSLFSSNKHHCRYCGCIGCDGCCPYRLYKDNDLRTCNNCYNKQRYHENIKYKKKESWMKKYFIFKQELLLYGYVREFCNLTFMPFLNDHVMKILDLWLNIANDEWNKQHNHSKIVISMHSQCIELNNDAININPRLKNVYYYAFGTEIIEKGMMKTWQFMIKNDDENICDASIGIVEIEKIENYKQVLMNNDINYVGYGLELKGGYFRNMSKNDVLCLAAKDLKLVNGDIVTMTLDLTVKAATGMLMFEIERKNNDIIINRIAAQPDSYRQWILAVKLKSNYDKLLFLQRFEQKAWYLK